MKQFEFVVGKEAQEIVLMENKIVVRPIDVRPKKQVIITSDSKKDRSIKDFNGNHPYLAIVIAKEEKVAKVNVGDVVAISEAVIIAAARGSLSEIMLDGEACAVIHDKDIVGIMNFYKSKIHYGKDNTLVIDKD